MRRPLLLLAVLGVAAFAALTGDATLLTALPVLGLFALLAGGRYIGADRYAARLRRPPRARRRVPVVAARSRVAARPYGAVLLGANLGRRGPPARLLVA